MDPAILRAHMKSQGILIWQYANGIDESAVISSPPPAKGYGNSLTTPYDVMDCETARQYLLSLSETISARLRADGVKISVVSISLKMGSAFLRTSNYTICSNGSDPGNLCCSLSVFI